MTDNETTAAAQGHVAVNALQEVACDLHYLMGRASQEGHEAGQRLAGEVQAKMKAAIAALSAPGEAGLLSMLGELIRTQDNRITSHPVFVVEQQRRVCGVEDDYADGHMWYDAQAVESYDDEGKAPRDADRAADGSPPISWQRGGYVDTWEFVTACFTEQGCKDYIAVNGHNLREPRIYVHSGWRNAEWIALRELIAAAPPPTVAADPEQAA